MQGILRVVYKPFEPFFYPNCNYSISRENTQLHLFNMITRFIEENLQLTQQTCQNSMSIGNRASFIAVLFVYFPNKIVSTKCKKSGKIAEQ